MNQEMNELKICGVKSEDEIVCIKMYAENYVATTGEVYDIEDLECVIECKMDSIYDQIDSVMENYPIIASLCKINEEDVREVAEEILYESGDYIIVNNDKVLAWSESGQINLLDNYNALATIFGKEVADKIIQLRKLHLSHNPKDIEKARKIIAELKEIAKKKNIPKYPDEAYKKYFGKYSATLY